MDLKNVLFLVLAFLIGLFFGFVFSERDSDEIGILQQQIQNNENTIKSLRNEMDSLNTENSDLKEQINSLSIREKQEEEQEEIPITSSINLANWEISEIIEALATTSPDFENGKWFTYIYRDDGTYYDQLGPDFGKDPFSKIAYKERAEEFTVNSLRIFFLDSKEESTDYDLYLNSIEKETTIDKNLTCLQETGCFGLKIISCEKENTDYHSWYEGNYLFTTRKDKGDTLNAFENFYCK